VIEIVEAVAENGEAPYATWRSSLDPTTRARVAGALLKLAQGNFSSVKGVGGGVFEFRMHFGAGYRIYFGKEG
jgi:putative addiction module killer protein